MKNSVINASKAYRRILDDVLKNGMELTAGETKSTGKNQLTKDISNYSVVIENSLDRYVQSSINKLNLPGAISRFIWMMGANNRIKDIEFYWGPNVSKFSDDQIVMPGSNYGMRMITPSPGLNQVKGIIERLKQDPSSRRAAISIYHPEDAVRDSVDIPCAFGFFYQIRDNKLNTSIIMRSNNASFLFPYNIFEFTLLSEVIATELGIDLGVTTYQAISMHLYEKDFQKAGSIISESDNDNDFELPKIPGGSKPLSQINTLIKLEADLRHESMGISEDNIRAKIEEKRGELDSYWIEHYLFLLYHVTSSKLSDAALSEIVFNEIKSPLKVFLNRIVSGQSMAQSPDLFSSQRIGRGVRVDSGQLIKRSSDFDTVMIKLDKELQEKDAKVISMEEYKKLKENFNVLSLTGRDKINDEDVKIKLDELRSNKQ